MKSTELKETYNVKTLFVCIHDLMLPGYVIFVEKLQNFQFFLFILGFLIK